MGEHSRIRIKYGVIEVEYEGPDSFIKQELRDLISAISELAQSQEESPSPAAPEVPISAANRLMPPAIATLMPNSLAAKLGADSGPDLALVAAAYLSLVKGREPFTRQELLDAMKLATSYFKTTYRNNLGSTLDRLVKTGKFLEVGAGSYSLHASQKSEVQSKLTS